MNIAKKACSVFMSFVLAAGLCPTPAWADVDVSQPTQGSGSLESASGWQGLTSDGEESTSAGADQAQGADASLPSASTTDDTGDDLERSFAVQLAEQVESGEATANANAQLIEPPFADDDTVMVIVRLQDSAAQDENALSVQSSGGARDHVKSQITNLVNGRKADEDAPWWESLPLLSIQSDASLDVKYDYSTLMQGFAVAVPYRCVNDIKQLPGVANAFVEHTYTQAGADDESLVAAQAQAYYNNGSLSMVGATDSAYTGKGTVSAIIDSGVDTYHEAFAALASGYKLDESAMSSLVSAAGDKFHGKGYKYVNSKMPFSYDYADADDEATPSTSTNEHGTHVAGIVGANGGSIIRGVAPDTQIVPMKVATDLLGTIADSDIIAALEDAVNLGVDTVNISLGSDVGFPADNNEDYQLVYDSVKAAGVQLNVAAGNADSAAAYNNSGADLPYASDPDDSIVASPSTYAAAVSVASVNATSAIPYLTIEGDSEQILCQPSSNGGSSFANLNGSFSLYDAKYGLDANYTQTHDAATETNVDDADGKIAVIERGSVDEEGVGFTFLKKITYAANHGAVAAIVYNNIEDSEELITMSIDESPIPAVFVTFASGQKLVAAANRGNKVRVAPTQTTTPDSTTMSTFSSIGVNANMDLKPEITAPGGNIYSSVLNNGYTTMSGTSMATPHMTGLSAAVTQYLEEQYPGLSASERRTRAYALLMSTAAPIRDKESYYTPRKQGAGLANLTSATSSPAYLSVAGSDLPKGNLGASPEGAWSLAFTVNNTSGQALAYTFDTAALSADIADGLISRHSTNYAGNGMQVTYSGSGVSGNTLTVPANGSTDVTVSITAQEAFKQAVAAADKGTFVDGFIMLKHGEGSAVDLSLPFVAFYGSWSAPKIFDAVQGDGTSAHMRTTYPYHVATQTQLGINPVDSSSTRVDTSTYTVAPNSYLNRCSEMTTATGLLRSADRLTYTFTPKGTNTVVKDYTADDVKKSYMYTSNGIVTYAEAFMGIRPSFDGTDAAGNQLPAGWYTETIQACAMDGDDTPDDAISFDFYLDTNAPEVTNVAITETTEWDDSTSSFKDVKKIKLTVHDYGFIAGVQLASTSGGAASGMSMTPESVQRMDADHEQSSAVYVFDYDDVVERLSKSSNSNQNMVIANVFDYGLNFTEHDVVLVDTYPSGISVDPESAALMVGQTQQVNAQLQGDNLTATNIAWTSDDESVASVDSTGLVKANGAGSATITATAQAASGQTPPSAQMTVTVSDVSDETGIVLDRSSYNTVEGSTFTLTATRAASLASRPISWEASEGGVIAQVSAPSGSSASFRALKAGTATVTASVGGKSATCTVNVSATNASDFIIDENGVLTNYVGSSVDVVIPPNVKSIGTRSDYGAGEAGGGDATADVAGVFQGLPIETIVIPDSVESICDYAFDNCNYLRSVEVQGSNLESIGRHAFSSTYKLSTIALPDSVTAIGDYAFYYTGLMRFTVPSGVTEMADHVLDYNANLRSLAIRGNLTRIGTSSLQSTPTLSEMTPLNEGITEIADSAFSGCGLPSIALPSTVRTVGDYAFMSTSATTLTLNAGLESIGTQAFSYSSAETLAIPDSVTSVGQEALTYSTVKELNIGASANKLVLPVVDAVNLTSITVAASNPNMTVGEDGCLYDKEKTELIAYPLGRKEATFSVPDSIVTIDACAFYDDSALAELNIGESLKSIGAQAFRHTSLTELVDTKNLESVGNNSFSNNSTLKRVEFNAIKTIEAYAFAYDSELTSIDLGNSLVSIGPDALNFTNVKEIALPDTCTTVGDGAWSFDTSLEEVHIGKGLTKLGTEAFAGCQAMQTLTIDAANTTFSVDEGSALYENLDGGGKALRYWVQQSTVTDYTVLPGTLSISDKAVFRCANLQKVVLPEGLKKIGETSFGGTNLTSMTLPSTLEEIGGFAFSDNNYDTLVVPANIKKIDETAFWFTGVKHLVLLGTQTQGLEVPGGAENLRTLYIGPGYGTIGLFAFDDASSLRTVVIDSPLTSIDDEAFDSSKSIDFYVNVAYPATKAITSDLGIGTVLDYTPLGLDYTVSPVHLTPAGSFSVTVTPKGGISDNAYRFDVGGTQGEWGTATTYTGTVPGAGETTTVSAVVRDASMLERTQDIVITGGGFSTGSYRASVRLCEADGTTRSPYDALVDGQASVTIQDSGAARISLSKSALASGEDMGIAVGGAGGIAPTAGSAQSFELSYAQFEETLDVNLVEGSMSSPVALKLVIDGDSIVTAADKTLLQTAIGEAMPLNGLRYTTDSWNQLSSALDAALDVNDDPYASQADVSEAASALQTAIASLKRNDAKYVWNNAGTYNVELGISQQVYSSSTNCPGYKGLVSTSAQIIVNSDTTMKLRVTVQPAVLAENSYGYGGSVTAQDLTELPSIMTASGTKGYATLVSSDEAAGTAVYDMALANTSKAITFGLYFGDIIPQDQFLVLTVKSDTIESVRDEDVADKSELADAYNRASQIDLSAYANGKAKTTFEEALADARGVLKYKSVGQSDVDAATDALIIATQALKPLGDADTLNATISAAEAYLTGSYTAATLDELNKALASARLVASSLPTATEADSATLAVIQAIAQLQASSDATAEALAAAQLRLEDAIAAAERFTDAEKTSLGDGGEALGAALADARAARTSTAAEEATSCAAALEQAVKDANAELDSDAARTALGDVIDAALATAQDNKTDAAYASLRTALQDARAVHADTLATPGSLAAATTSLENAIAAFESQPDQADAGELAYTIAKAKGQRDAAATKSADAASAFASALSAAEQLLGQVQADGTAATQAQVDAQARSLSAATETYLASVNAETLQNLQSLHDSVSAVTQGNKVASAWAALQAALRSAGDSLLEASLTEEAGQQAISDLRAAAIAFGQAATVGDKTQLAAAIEQADGITQGSKTNAAWNQFGAALASAKAVNANGDATQQQVDTATANLLAAIEAFANAEEKATAELSALVTTAGALPQASFTSTTWAALETVLSSAQATLSNAQASDEALATARDNLQMALEGLALTDEGTHTIPITYLQHNSDAASEAAKYLKPTAQIASDGNGGFKLTISVDPGYERYNIRFSDEATGEASKVFPHENEYDFTMPIDSMFQKNTAWVHLNPIYEMHHQFDIVLDPTSIVSETADTLGMITGRVYTAESDIWKADDSGRSMAAGYFNSTVELVKVADDDYYAMLTATDAGNGLGVRLADASGNDLEVISATPLVFKVPIADPKGKTRIQFRYYTTPVATSSVELDSSESGGDRGGLSAQGEDSQVADLYFPGLSDGSAQVSVEAVDKAALSEAVASASEIERGSKTDAAFTSLGMAIQEAQDLIDRSNATQAEVNAEVDKLAVAIGDFNGSPEREGDKTVLNSVIKGAQASLDATAVSTDGSDLEPSRTWTTVDARVALQTALADAQAIVADVNAAQDAVDAAVQNLAEAHAAFDTARKAGTKSAAPAVQRITMNRLYNPNSGEHFYTSSASERDSLVRLGWRAEGTGWIAPTTSNTPVYRLYNPNAGDHHYTTSANERDSLMKAGWRYEGVGWYSDDAKGEALYRLYNPNAVAGAHHYTTSAAERENLKRVGWKDEGVGWYGLK